MFEEEIKRIIKNNKIDGNWCRSDRYLELKNYLNTNYNFAKSYAEKLYLFVNKITEVKKCLCGNDLMFRNFRTGYRKTCCPKCSLIYSKESRTLANKKAFQEKSEDEKRLIIEKRKKTTLDRYGVENLFSDKTIREKYKITMIERYGKYLNVDKIKRTKLERYDSEGYSNSSKAIKTKLERYGKTNMFDLVKSKETLRHTMFHKYSNLENATNLFSFEEYKGTAWDVLYLWRCNKCKNEFKDNITSGLLPRCPICSPKGVGPSLEEKEVLSFIESLNLEIEENTRDIISPLELDIYIPSKNVAIEYNGSYWHSSEFKEKWYHQIKTELCNRKGIRLLHVFDHEWTSNNEETKKKIISFIDSEEKIKIRNPICFFIQNGLKKYSELDLTKEYMKIWD